MAEFERTWNRGELARPTGLTTRARRYDHMGCSSRAAAPSPVTGSTRQGTLSGCTEGSRCARVGLSLEDIGGAGGSTTTT